MSLSPGIVRGLAPWPVADVGAIVLAESRSPGEADGISDKCRGGGHPNEPPSSKYGSVRPAVAGIRIIIRMGVPTANRLNLCRYRYRRLQTPDRCMPRAFWAGPGHPWPTVKTPLMSGDGAMGRGTLWVCRGRGLTCGSGRSLAYKRQLAQACMIRLQWSCVLNSLTLYGGLAKHSYLGWVNDGGRAQTRQFPIEWSCHMNRVSITDEPVARHTLSAPNRAGTQLQRMAANGRCCTD